MLSGGRQPPPLSTAQRERKRNSYRETFAVYANQAREGKKKKRANVSKITEKEKSHFRSVFFFCLKYSGARYMAFPTSRAFFKWLCVSDRGARPPAQLFVRFVAI